MCTNKHNIKLISEKCYESYQMSREIGGNNKISKSEILVRRKNGNM